MFVIQKNKNVTVNEKLSTNRNILVKVAGVKKEIELKVLALNGDLLTVCESTNPGVIFIVDAKTSKIKNVVTNQEMIINSAITSKDKLPVDIATMTFAGIVKTVSKEELFVGDTFLYNKVQEIKIMYISEDKTLMVVKFVSSNREISVKDDDINWLSNTQVKGVAN